MVKKILYILLGVLLASCEVIDESERLIPLPEQATNSTRRHVLLEFTGFRCVNCPTAAATAQTLQELYGEQLTIVALHPASNPFTQGKKEYDYTCPAADSVYLFMGGTNTTTFPTGNINLASTADDYFSNPVEWASLLHAAMADTVCPYLNMQATLYTGGENRRTMVVQVSTGNTIPIDARLAIWVVEDSIRGMQAMPDNSVNTEYIHRHVLRSAFLDAPFGVPIQLQSTVTQVRLTDELPESCAAEQCHLVALLLDKNDYHILQAYETKLVINNTDVSE